MMAHSYQTLYTTPSSILDITGHNMTSLPIHATSWKTMDSVLLGVMLGLSGIRKILKLVPTRSYLGSLSRDPGVLGCSHQSNQVH